MNKFINSKILNGLVIFGIVITVIALLFTPLVLTAFFKTQGVYNSNLPMIISVAIYICAIPYLVALVYLKKLCKLIGSKDAFSRNIPRIINWIGISAFSEVVLFNFVNIGLYYFYGLYFYALTVFSCIIVTFVSAIIGFFALVSSNLFNRVIEIKEENDATI